MSRRRSVGKPDELLWILFCISQLSCQHPQAEISGTRILLDRQLASFDAVSPHTSFDGEGGSLFTTEGWAPSEDSTNGSFAWAIDGESLAYFDAPPGISQLDLWASCAPLAYPSSPDQELTVYLNGDRAEGVILSPGWQEVRVPLPPAALKEGLNEVKLEFARATRPIDVGLNADKRRLTARFRVLAVIPRGVPNPRSFLDAAHASGSRPEIELPIGGAYAIPLPPASDLLVNANLSETRCRSCRLVAELLEPFGEVHRLDSLSVPGKLNLKFSTKSHGVSRLRLRVESAERAFDAGSRLRIRLGEHSLSVKHRELQAPDRPHVFIYMIDTLRADALEPYGAPAGSSPRATAFADEAIVYEYAWAPSSWTLPSTVSLLTGVLPRRHGVMKGDVKLSPESSVRSLAARLSDAGYRTLGISQSFVASGRFGVDTGYSEFFLDNQLNSRALRSQTARGLLVRLIAASLDHDTSLFAYIHTVDPHTPYAPPEGYRGLAEKTPGNLSPELYSPLAFMTQEFSEDPAEVAHLRALYQGEVQYADARFGEFLRTLEYLRFYDHSLIALVSDHGEEFAEHGGFDHGRTVYEEMLRIPLIVKYPDQKKGGRIGEPVSTIDLAPTICELAMDQAECDGFDGPSLPQHSEQRASRRVLLSEVNPAPSEHLHEVDYEALLLDHIKCILSRNEVDQFGSAIPRWSAYDLEADPEETDRLDPEQARAMRCFETLTRLDDLLGEGELATERTPEGDLDKLRALGYIR